MTLQVRFLELAERARAATSGKQSTPTPIEPPPRSATEHMLARYRQLNPPGSIDRGAVCPDAACDSAATVEGAKLSCQQCGRVWQRVAGAWGVVGECRLWHGGFA